MRLPAGAAAATKGPSTNSTTAVPPAALVRLQYDAERSGSLVWVQTMDGGTLTAVDAEGVTHTAAGGFYLEINALGFLEFTFQAPGQSDRYQVFTRLDNVVTTLPFTVLSPGDQG